MDISVFLYNFATVNEYYYYGVAAAIYIALCWTFVAVRWFHTCQQPKEHRAAIWPDRIICTSGGDGPEFGYTPGIDNDMNHLA